MVNRNNEQINGKDKSEKLINWGGAWRVPDDSRIADGSKYE